MARFEQALHFTKENVTEGGPEIGLFSKFIENFYKLKKCNSGYPDWCKSSSQREEYVQKLSDELQMPISTEDITDNPSLKYIAKLILNRYSILFLKD